MKRPPVIVVQLVHISGPLKGEIQTFSEECITIGRNPGCYLHFPPDLTCVSRNQAEIVREGNQFKLIDHSSNGTFVNGKQATEAYLKNGDILEFSQGGPKVSFLTEIREAPVEAARPSRPPVREEPGPAPQPAAQRRIIQPVREQRDDIPADEICKTLTIQYGPTIRSFNKLPVTLGRKSTCEFVLDDPAVLDRHAQVFYSQDKYWIKDLSGQNSVLLNNMPIGLQAPLKIGDEIALSPRGPMFRFVGEGRLAEISRPAAEIPSPGKQKDIPGEKESGGLLAKFRKYLDEKLK
jgi:pSer/pThr/pTyr-binding forkhead associated (FHA) protein